jgi:probable rRNA maturation factor
MVIFRKTVAGLNERVLSAFVARAKREVGLQGEVNILLTNNRELRALNSRFRKKDAPTDVLSFPAITTAEPLAGDVAISVTIAAQNAKQLGHVAAEEVKILVLHGMLHLAGYDHERDNGEMARREQQLRKRLRLPVGLIERSGNLRGPVTSSGKRLTHRPSRMKQKVP